MSRPPQYENEAYGADGVPGAHGTGAVGAPPEVPSVYLPQGESTPPYEEYVDPAAAHGWQNAYDQTAELPQVADAWPVAVGAPPAGAELVPVRGPGPGHRRSRRKPSRWRSRRVVIAAGAAGAVSAVALIAGFSFSGSSSDGPQGKEGGTRSAPDEATGPEGSSSSAGPASSGSDTSGPGGPAPGEAAASSGPGASPDEKQSGEPSAGSSTAPAVTSSPTATASAPADTAPGNSDRKGRGPGSTKAPK